MAAISWLDRYFAKVIAFAGVEKPQRAQINFTGAGVVITDDPTNDATHIAIAGGGGTLPAGTGFRHMTTGAEDVSAKLVFNSDVDAFASIHGGKIYPDFSGETTGVQAIGYAGRETSQGGAGPFDDLNVGSYFSVYFPGAAAAPVIVTGIVAPINASAAQLIHLVAPFGSFGVACPSEDAGSAPANRIRNASPLASVHTTLIRVPSENRWHRVAYPV